MIKAFDELPINSAAEVKKKYSFPLKRNKRPLHKEGIKIAEEIAIPSALKIKATFSSNTSENKEQCAVIEDSIPQVRNDNGKKKTPAIDLANALLKKYYFLRDGAHLYVYDEALGYYVILNEGYGSFTFDSLVRSFVPNEVKVRLNSYDVIEIQKWLLCDALNVPNVTEFMPKKLVAFRNGTYNFDNNLLRKHSAKDGLICGLNANYDDKAYKKIRNTVFWDFLQRLTDGKPEIIQTIRELIGLSLSNIRRLKLLFYLVGVSNNGKSVLADLIISMLPHYCCSSFEISELSNRFSRGSLYGKHINISSDEDTSTWPNNSIAFIKKAVAGDMVKGEEKYKTPFMYRCRALFICLSNAMPKYTSDQDAGGAISRRLFVIPTTNTPINVEEEDHELLYKLLSERDIIASWAITGITNIVLYGQMPQKLIDAMPSNESLEFETAFEQWSNDFVFKNDVTAKTEAATFLESFKIYASNYNVIFSDKAFYMKFASRYKFHKRDGKRSYYLGLNCTVPNADSIF